MLDTELTRLLQIVRPIIQAPMAGGPTSPELVAAVTGGDGSRDRLQGAEAGGHRSTFELGPGREAPLVRTIAPVPQVVDAVSSDHAVHRATGEESIRNRVRRPALGGRAAALAPAAVRRGGHLRRRIRPRRCGAGRSRRRRR